MDKRATFVTIVIILSHIHQYHHHLNHTKMDHPIAQFPEEASIYYVAKFYILIIVVYDLASLPSCP